MTPDNCLSTLIIKGQPGIIEQYLVSGAETGIHYKNHINIKAADILAPCIARSSAAM